jgi:hypothetical protein
VDALAVDALAVDALAVDALAVDALAVDALAVDALAVDALAVDALAVDALAVPLRRRLASRGRAFALAVPLRRPFSATAPRLTDCSAMVGTSGTTGSNSRQGFSSDAVALVPAMAKATSSGTGRQYDQWHLSLLNITGRGEALSDGRNCDVSANRDEREPPETAVCDVHGPPSKCSRRHAWNGWPEDHETTHLAQPCSQDIGLARR